MTIGFKYDPWRGGFYLGFSGERRARVQSAFGSLMSIHFDSQDQIVAIESFFGDYGGVPLRGLHKTDQFSKGYFLIEGLELRVGSFQIRQNEDKLEVWFSTGNELPRDHWTKRRDENSGITAWFSRRKAKAGVGTRVEYMLAGLAVEFSQIAVAFPISSVHLAVEDFK